MDGSLLLLTGLAIGGVCGFASGLALSHKVPSTEPQPPSIPVVTHAAFSLAEIQPPATQSVGQWKAHTGKPLRVISSDDGTTHYHGYDGAEALQVWERLKHGPALSCGVTWYEDHEVRDRLEAALDAAK